MYGTDKPHLPWGASHRRRSTQVGGEELDSTQRYSTGGTNYFGMDGSESSASGGFTQVSRGPGHSRSASTGYQASTTGEGNNGAGPVEKSQRDKVNQIVQQFFWKAAMVIIQQRIPTVPMVSPKTGEKKTNKWVLRLAI
jgi:autophagy-related protein 13